MEYAMAAVTPNEYARDRRLGTPDRRRTDLAFARPLTTEGIRISWGGVWGGVLASVGLLLLLAALGMAVGITATDPQAADGQKLGIAAAAWAGISLLIALFVGGMVSTRVGAIFDRHTGFWEGALVWVVTLLLMAYLATTSLSTLMGGTLRVMGGAAQAAATATQGAATQNPGVNAAISNPSSVVQDLKSRLSNAEANGTIQQKAAEAKPAATKAAWATFAALVLSLLASILGSVAGRRRHPLER
jgi:hypothetical protein